MNETLLVRKCKSRKLKDGTYICSSLKIPCKDVKREDCPLMEEYRIIDTEKGDKNDNKFTDGWIENSRRILSN